MRVRALLAAGAALALIAPAVAAAEDFAIVNATVGTGDGSEPVRDGVVIVKSGKVVYAGPRSGAAAFEGDAVYDVGGKWVTPGLFASATTLGLYDVEGVAASNDSSGGKSIFGAALDVAPALNPASQHVAVARAAGLTRASIYSRPSGSIFGGQGAIVDFGADPDMVVQPQAFQVVALGETGARIAGGSRTASFAELAAAMRDAGEVAAGQREPDDSRLNRADAEALAAVLSGKQALYVAVNRASDIRQVLGLKRTWPKLRLVLLGASEGWLVAGEIAAAGVPVIANPMEDLPVSFEQLAATQSNVGRMAAAGVRVAIGTLEGGTGEQPRNAAQFAGNLVGLQKLPGASGLSWGQALASITSVPAAIAGFAGRYGVLKPGAVGDLVIWDGDPLEVSSAPVDVFIDGVRQPRENHQTRLRDRYRDLDESDLPKAYDH